MLHGLRYTRILPPLAAELAMSLVVLSHIFGYRPFLWYLLMGFRRRGNVCAVSNILPLAGSGACSGVLYFMVGLSERRAGTPKVLQDCTIRPFVFWLPFENMVS